MKEYKYWHDLRNKENKSKEELMLLESRKALITISEMLLNYRKNWLDPIATLDQINDKVQDILEILE